MAGGLRNAAVAAASCSGTVTALRNLLSGPRWPARGPGEGRAFGDFASGAVLVVLGVGVLGALAMAQFHKVAERARLVEARGAISALAKAQESFRTRHRRVVVSTAEVSKLDTDVGDLRNFRLEAREPSSGPHCPREGDQAVAFRRTGVVAARWGEYRVRYDGCAGTTSFPGCDKCHGDFAEE